ncbi:MAG: NADH-quinone oxidoreductase subunit C [Candidatus Sericytochromatia bacterium]|nr:NADH-quinone oxidoreductase subunit C [Candidatus Sericytochromatia bacterium]
MANVLQFPHGASFRLADLPIMQPADFHRTVCTRVGNGWRLIAMPGVPQQIGGLLVFAVLAQELGRTLLAVGMRVQDGFPSLTPQCPQAQAFERELAEQWGIVPVGHPWLKPLRFQPPRRPVPMDRQPPQAGDAPFFTVTGDAVYEVAVGPVHAGIIEPGHFRFQLQGEDVVHLEIALGYQHRGIERALTGGPDLRSRHLVETAAGDTTVGHATAHAQALEILSGTQPSHRSHAIRAIGLELERLANHVGDLGSLSGDVGFLPTAAFCGRLRGDFLNLTAMICGNRFGRQLVRPGGVGFDLDRPHLSDLLDKAERAGREVAEAVELLWQSPSVMNRFEDTAPLSRAHSALLGLVGPAARASGLPRDVRAEFPSTAYLWQPFNMLMAGGGDVHARAYQRWREIGQSLQLITDLADRLANLPADGPLALPVPSLPPLAVAVSLVEGWRGEICHVAVTDRNGRFKAYKIIDPSFRNWLAVPVTMRQQAISDFPLCNKSFSLSYCGHDL